jgi:hypothetical protein
MLVIAMLLILSNEGCYNNGVGDCGSDCTGRPHCDGKRCGNINDMCYCNFTWNGIQNNYKCVTSDLGYKWYGGIKLANGSYALNGTKGDGK